MDRSFEHTVLAYLDGLLDRREEREFLKEVSRSPQKRAVLDQYRRLEKTLKNRGIPLAVPLKAQRALAEKLPVLKDTVRPRIPQQFAGRNATTAGSFFSRTILRSGRIISLLLLGGVVAVLITGLILTDSITFFQADAGKYPMSAVTSSTANDGSDAADRAANAVAAEDLTSSQTTNMRDAGSGNPASGHLQTTRAMHSPHGSDAMAESTDGNSSSSRYRETAPVRGGTSRLYANTTAELTSVPLKGFAMSDAMSGIPVEIRQHPSATASLRELFGGKLYACLETGAADVRSAGSGNLVQNVMRGVYVFALRYDISPQFAAGIEYGQSTFSSEELVATTEQLSDGSGTQVIIIDPVLKSDSRSWLRMHTLYTLNPDDRLRFQADGGAGILLSAGTQPLFSAGISSVYSLSYALQLRAGIHYTGAWLRSTAPLPEIITSPSSVIGIIRNAEHAGTVYRSSIEFRVGFGVLLW